MPQTQKQLDNLIPFSKTNVPVGVRPGTKRGPYLTPLLKKFLNKKIKYEDPDSGKIIKGKVKDAIIWRLILNASQGDNTAIKEILDRIDGKLQAIKDDGSDEARNELNLIQIVNNVVNNHNGNGKLKQDKSGKTGEVHSDKPRKPDSVGVGESRSYEIL